MREERPFAFGVLGLLPADYYALMPREYQEAVRGWAEQWRERRRLIAWHAGHCMIPHVKKSRQRGLVRSLMRALVPSGRAVKPSVTNEEKKEGFFEKLRRQRKERKEKRKG